MEEKEAKEGPERSPAKYDPKKYYEWDKDSHFYMSGEEFGSVLNAIRAILASPEAQRIMMLEKAGMNLENVISRAVENGVARETVAPPKRN